MIRRVDTSQPSLPCEGFALYARSSGFVGEED